jgi:hypothetical protein
MTHNSNNKWWLKTYLPPHSCLPLLPLLTFGSAYVLYETFKRTLNIEERNLEVYLECQLSEPTGVGPFVALLTWGISAIIYAMTWISATTVILVQTRASLSNRVRIADHTKLSRAPDVIVLLLLGLALTLGVAAGYVNPMTVGGVKDALAATFCTYKVPEGEFLLHTFNGLGIATALLLMVSASVALWATNRSSLRPLQLPAIEQLRQQIAGIHQSLYAGTVVLVTAVIQAKAMHLLPAALTEGATKSNIEEVAKVYVTAQGTLWTIALLAFYVPAISVLSRRVNEVANYTISEIKWRGQSPPPTLKKWLEDNDVTPSLSKRIAALGATLAPFLTGATIVDLLKIGA